MMTPSLPFNESLLERGLGVAIAVYLGREVLRWFGESRKQISQQAAKTEEMVADLREELKAANAEKAQMSIEYLNSIKDFRAAIENLSGAITELREEMRDLKEKNQVNQHG